MIALALATLAGCYLAVVVAVYAWQDSLIYFPSAEVPAPERAGLKGASEVALRADDGVALHAWYVAPAAPTPPAAVVVLFHGNAGNIAGRAWKAEILTKAGFAALLFDYRGYGRSEGRPSEAGLYADGRAAAAWAHETARRGGGAPVIYYGESLGCAIAIETSLSAGLPAPAGLVLEAPFASLAAVGSYHYGWLPVRALLRTRYDNLEKIGRVREPILVIHGENDQVIPPAQGRALCDAAVGAPSKRVVAVPAADHNEAIYFDPRPLVEGLCEMATAARAAAVPAR